MAAARLRWEGGASWEETEAYDQMLRLITQTGKSVDGCRSLDEVVRRYERLDAVFEQVREDRRLRSRSELPLPDRGFREVGGVYVHLGRSGQPIFGGGGFHRLAIARVLELPEIPAQLGVVHEELLRRGSVRPVL